MARVPVRDELREAVEPFTVPGNPATQGGRPVPHGPAHRLVLAARQPPPEQGRQLATVAVAATFCTRIVRQGPRARAREATGALATMAA